MGLQSNRPSLDHYQVGTETDKVSGRTIMIPDTPHGPLAAARIAVIDMARAWQDLTAEEREAIHRGERGRTRF